MRADLLGSAARPLRAAIYARYSTDNQSGASVTDQLRMCRAYAAQLGAVVVREFSDEEISGTVDARPGFEDLMDFVRAKGCDLVIAEHTDRLHRGGSGGWRVFETLQDLGVGYRTIMEDEVTALKQSVSTLVSTHKIEEVRYRTRRGLQGVVEGGRSGGGMTYGYRLPLVYDERGERKRGLLEIDPERAAIVTRIFRDYASGVSPLAIATALNAEGVPSPRGGAWSSSTIAGNAKRGNGIIHNELYVGMRVWGRQIFVKDRRSGKRRGRYGGSPEDPMRVPVPELRIIDQDLWDDVRARHAQVSGPGTGGRPVGRRRPTRFLQGLIVCGECGATMRRAGPRDALRCATRVEKGACDMTRSPGYAGIEARVIAAIRGNLLHPAVIEHAIDLLRKEAAVEKRDAVKQRARRETELATARRRLAQLVDRWEREGVPWAAIAGRHAELQAEVTRLETLIAAPAEAEVVELSPAAAARYRQTIEALTAALDDPEDLEGREDRGHVRSLIEAVRVHPLPVHGQYQLEIVGDLAPILDLGQQKAPSCEGASRSQSMGRLGAGTGFEPVTFRL